MLDIQDEKYIPQLDDEFYSDYFLRYGNSYMCKLCPHISPGNGMFATHIKMSHKEIRVYKCKFCDREFYAEYKCANHIRHNHFDQLKNAGDKCFIEFCHTVGDLVDSHSRSKITSVKASNAVCKNVVNNGNSHSTITIKQEENDVFNKQDSKGQNLSSFYNIVEEEEVVECDVHVLNSKFKNTEEIDESHWDKPEGWEPYEDSDVDELEAENGKVQIKQIKEEIDEDGPSSEPLSTQDSPVSADDESLEDNNNAVDELLEDINANGEFLEESNADGEFLEESNADGELMEESNGDELMEEDTAGGELLEDNNDEIAILGGDINEVQQIVEDDDDILEIPTTNAVSIVGSSQQQPLFDQLIFQNISDFTDVIPFMAESTPPPPKKKKKIQKENPLSTFGKPNFSYSQLIYLAFKNSFDNFLFVSQIYLFIMDHFPHFRTAPNTWKNSIRHTLCGSKCFLKSTTTAPADTGKHRKNMYWTLSPQQNTIDKMETEIDKVITRNYQEISNCMVNPENLPALQSGLMKKRYAHNNGPDNEGKDGASSSTSNELVFETEIAEPEEESTLRIDSAYSTAPVISQGLSMSDFSDSHEFSLLDPGMDIGYQNVEMDPTSTYLYYVYQ